MSAHFEVVRTDAEQSWHARLIVNGHRTWWVENLSRQVGAERAILSLFREIAGDDAWLLRWNVKGVEKVAVSAWGVVHPLIVRYVDERKVAS